MAIGWGEAAVLGLVQGLTEFLPVSSSAHLRIVGPLLPSGGDPGAAFTAITQIGTELAVLIYFRRELWAMAIAWWQSLLPVGAGLIRGRAPSLDADARMGWLILIGTLPIAILGLLFKGAIETSLRNLYLTAGTLIGFALLLAYADRFGAKRRNLDSLGWRDGLLFGLAQALALIPGVSRSGGTITAGLLMGFSRESSARYAFLLAVPAVMASGFYQLIKSWGSGPVAAGPTALATAVAFVVGYGVIVAFLKLVSVRSYLVFVVYRVLLGLAVLAMLQLGVLSAL